jgi:hypothetical protein
MKTFIEMLEYMRPESGKGQSNFCNRFLRPVFGKPDEFGNYILRVGQSRIAFMAHHDTVHDKSGKQIVEVINNIAMLPEKTESSCLGADCTSGVWLMLEMVKAGIAGVYVVHAGEEIGCVGSRAIVDVNPIWLDNIDAAISFDRRGFDSIVTHQMGMRTCSHKFAVSLSDILGLYMKPDDTGSYTDSNEYAGIVPECTNISVGYFGQHSKRETQDLTFLSVLRDALLVADFSGLVIERNPADSFIYSNDSIEDIIADNPECVAEILADLGYTAESLLEEIDFGYSRKLRA